MSATATLSEYQAVTTPRLTEAELATLEPWLRDELTRGDYRYCDFTGRLDPPTDEGFDG